MGHAEVAAGLVATLLSSSPSEALTARAMALLERAIAGGGDCRLVGGLQRDRFTGTTRRLRDLIDIRCAARRGPAAALEPTRRFLTEATDDALAWEATLPVLDLPQVATDRDLALLVGLAAYRHRDFDHALRLLAPWNAQGTRGPFDQLGNDASYAEARSAFWKADYAHAAELFRGFALKIRDGESRADAWYQRARSLELGGDVDGAHEALLRSLAVDTRGPWAGAVLVSLLRLEYLQGDLSGARRRLTELASSPAFASHAARGALFFASSEIERGRTSRVFSLLAAAEQTREISPVELAYWRGRYFEEIGESTRAFEQLTEALVERPFHPLAVAARSRLIEGRYVRQIASQLAAARAGSDPRALQLAAALTTSADLRRDLAERGRQRLVARPGDRAWIDGAPVPVGSWPLWEEGIERAEEKLVAIGLVGESPTAVARRFPASRSRLGLTGAELLIDEGAVRPGLALAESAFQRLPREVPLDWVATRWLRTLYPLPWAELIRSQAEARGVDPALLAAVLREESRFDPRAVSPAAARGLSQMILPTARRLAGAAGRNRIEMRDLEDPLVSIPLGAAYLAELSRRFQGQPVAMVAAYNAGEDQTALWQRYCSSSEPEELLAKIGFGETRAYVTRVLESRNAYEALASTP